jgi:hypothetical protein
LEAGITCVCPRIIVIAASFDDVGCLTINAWYEVVSAGGTALGGRLPKITQIRRLFGRGSRIFLDPIKMPYYILSSWYLGDKVAGQTPGFDCVAG